MRQVELDYVEDELFVRGASILPSVRAKLAEIPAKRDPHKEIFRTTAYLDRYYALHDALPELSDLPNTTEWLRMQLQYDCYRRPYRLLKEWQVEAAAFLAAASLRQRYAVLAMAPGLGKTATAIFTAREFNFRRVLVVAPLSLLYNWKAEILRWYYPSVPAIRIRHKENLTLLTEPFEGEALWEITNYDTIIRQTQYNLLPEELYYSLVILDETALVKNSAAQRTKLVFGRSPHPAMKKGERKIPGFLERFMKKPVVWELSGNPAPRQYDDLWAQWWGLDRRRFASYWRFANRYCQLDTTVWGTKVVDNQAGAHERIKRDFADFYFCRSMDEVTDIPDWVIETRNVPMTVKQNRAYLAMADQFCVILEGAPAVSINAPNTLARTSRLLQLASNLALVGGGQESGKLDCLPELLSACGRPAIVWVQYTLSLEAVLEVCRRLKLYARTLSGTNSPLERAAIVEEFQRGEMEVLVCQTDVGKYGLTLTRAATSIYLERDWDGDAYYQSLYRVRRIGTTVPPVVIKLLSVSEGGATIDHAVDVILDHRSEGSEKLTTHDLAKALRASERANPDKFRVDLC